jgi:hypothetical protein
MFLLFDTHLHLLTLLASKISSLYGIKPIEIIERIHVAMFFFRHRFEIQITNFSIHPATQQDRTGTNGGQLSVSSIVRFSPVEAKAVNDRSTTTSNLVSLLF